MDSDTITITIMRDHSGTTKNSMATMNTVTMIANGITITVKNSRSIHTGIMPASKADIETTPKTISIENRSH